MGLVVKLSLPGPEFRLFEIDRDTPYPVLLYRIAARLPSKYGQKTPSGEDKDEDEDVPPLEPLSDGVAVRDFAGDWITVTGEEEWALYLSSCVPLDQEQFVVNMRLRRLSSNSQGLRPISNSIHKLGSAIKNLIIAPLLSTSNKHPTKPDATAATEGSEPNEDEDETTARINPEASSLSLGSSPSSEELPVEATFEIIDEQPAAEEYPDQDEEDEEDEEEQEDDEEEEMPPPENSIAASDAENSEIESVLEQPVISVPQELQSGWDVLVEMGFSDNIKMLQLLKKYKGKNLARIVDVLLSD